MNINNYPIETETFENFLKNENTKEYFDLQEFLDEQISSFKKDLIAFL
jgi:hypothetical protein